MVKKLYILLFVCLAIFLIGLIFGFSLFRNDTWSSGLGGITRGSIVLGDINNDGRMDLIASGQNTSVIIRVYMNNGTNLVENSTWENNLTAFTRGSIVLGDINNDGKLDLVLEGCTSDVTTSCTGVKISKVYINNNTSFIESSQWEQNLTPVYWGSLALGDINNDGKLDLGLVGSSDNGRIAKIYINNGTSFVENQQWQNSLTGIDEGSIAFGDINNDGKLDLALTGLKTASPYKISTIYINNGTNLVEDSGWWYPSYLLDMSSLAFGDVNNDGKLDLIHMGCCDHLFLFTNNGSSLKEYQNDTISGGDQLTGIFDGSLAFGDINNDGYLDLATMGREAQRLGIYQWNGTAFVRNDTIGVDFIADNMQQGSLAFIDINNDSKLDLISGGYSYGNGSMTKVYINNNTVPNTLPSPPTTNFSSNYSNITNVLTLGWGNGSDAETNTSGLYYNLMVGNATANNTIVSGVYGGSSNPTAGYFGNMMERVQTIDTSLAKSNWSARQSITVSADTTPPVISGISSSVTTSTATITWTTDKVANSTVYYGTTVSLGSSSRDTSLTQSHSIALSNLLASTIYYYNVSSCDASGNCNTSQQSSFTTSAEPVSPPNGGSPSGGGGIIIPVNKTIPKFDIDFSNVSTGTLEAKQGDIKTFSFNNEIKHSLTLLSVTSDSITLLITSEPITTQIKVGEMKEIDINGDNVNDIEIKLISILNGKANFSLNKLSGADIVAKEELGRGALFDVKVSISNLFKIVKSGGDVIAQIEVFNVNNIGQVDVTVNYYITSKEDNKTKLAQGSDTLAVEAVSSFVRSLTVPYNLKSGNYLFNVEVKYGDKIMASGSTEFTVIKSYEIIIAVGIIVFIIICLFSYLLWIRRKEKKIEEEEKKLKKEIKKLEKRKK